MLLIDYIYNAYKPLNNGIEKGCKALFLRDNPNIISQNLSRYFKSETRVNLKSGKLFKHLDKTINLKTNKSIDEDELLLIDYIYLIYKPLNDGLEKGCKALFLKDNENIISQNLSRYFKAEVMVNTKTGILFKYLAQQITIINVEISNAK